MLLKNIQETIALKMIIFKLIHEGGKCITKDVKDLLLLLKRNLWINSKYELRNQESSPLHLE